MFPGVGSQYTGMGKTYYDNFEVMRDTIAEASDILGMDFHALCFSAKEAMKLKRVEIAQVTLLTVCVGIWRSCRQEVDLDPDVGMGYSLGEYTALHCAGVTTFSDTLKLVQQRARIIHEVGITVKGTMIWVLNIDQNIIKETCQNMVASGGEQQVYVSASDAPTQASIAGPTEAVMNTARILEDRGALIYPLDMKGPFHTPLMATAAQQMRDVLMQFQFSPPRYPVIANVNARPYQGPESVVDNLSSQLVSPIRWSDSLAYVIGQGVNTAIETGPKDVLNFLVKKNTDNINTYNTNKAADLMALKEIQQG